MQFPNHAIFTVDETHLPNLTRTGFLLDTMRNGFVEGSFLKGDTRIAATPAKVFEEIDEIYSAIGLSDEVERAAEVKKEIVDGLSILDFTDCSVPPDKSETGAISLSAARSRWAHIAGLVAKGRLQQRDIFCEIQALSWPTRLLLSKLVDDEHYNIGWTEISAALKRKREIGGLFEGWTMRRVAIRLECVDLIAKFKSPKWIRDDTVEFNPLTEADIKAVTLTG